MLKMMAIADDRHFSYDGETELVQLDLILAQIKDLQESENNRSYQVLIYDGIIVLSYSWSRIKYL
jgi:hypothetical protein